MVAHRGCESDRAKTDQGRVVTTALLTNPKKGMEAYLDRRLSRLGFLPRGRYRTGVVAQVLGYSREWVRQRTELPGHHPFRIATVREGRYRLVPHDELLRLISAEYGG